MAFGQLKGTLQVNANSITNPFNATGSVTVGVGDAIVCLIGQQTNLTVTTVTDNLGNTYTAHNAGTDAGTVTGRAFYARVTVPGVLTSVQATTSASTNDAIHIAAVYEGPFASSIIDVTPANNNNTDNASPFTCPATGTLAQADEVVVSWMVGDGNATWSATSPLLKDIQLANSTNINGIIGHKVVSATTTTSPEFTGTNPTISVQGTFSLRKDLTAAIGGDRAGFDAIDEQWPRPALSYKRAGIFPTGQVFTPILVPTRRKRFFVKDALVAGTTNCGSLSLTDPGSSTTGTGWVVGTTAANLFSMMVYNSERAAGTFSGTDNIQGPPPIDSFGGAWRSEQPLNGEFATTPWTITFAVRAVTSANGQRGRMKIQVMKSSAANGSNSNGDLQILNGLSPLVGTTTDPLQTGISVTSICTFTPNFGRVFNNQYLFIVCEWETITPGGDANADVDIRAGIESLVETSDFTEANVEDFIAKPQSLVATRFKQAKAAMAATGLCFVAVPTAVLNNNTNAPFEPTLPVVQTIKTQPSALRGESIFAFYSPWQDLGFENQTWQPQHRRFERAAAILEGDDGIEGIKSISGAQLSDSDYPAQPYLIPLKRPKREPGALRGKSSFGFFTPWLDYGFAVQPIQPPNPKQERGMAATATGDAGIYRGLIRFVDYGFHIQPWQPPHRRYERVAALLEGDDGTQAKFVPAVTTPPFIDQPGSTIRYRLRSRAYAIDGDSQFVPFLDAVWGWENQAWQPPYNGNRRRGALLQGDLGNQAKMTVVVTFASYQDFQFPLLKTIKTNPSALRGESLFAFYSPWKDFGFENQSWQPPHVPREKRGNYLKGDEGIQAPFIFVSTTVRFFENINIQPPHPYREKRGAFLKGCDGTEAPYVPPVVFKFLEHTPVIQPVKTIKVQPSALRGESIFAFYSPWKDFGFERSPFAQIKPKRLISLRQDDTYQTFVGTPPLLTSANPWYQLGEALTRWPIAKRERHAGIAHGNDGTEAKFVFVPPVTAPPLFYNASIDLRQQLGNRKFALFGRADFRPFLDAIWGWENQSYQPPRAKIERRHGIGGTFGFLPFDNAPFVIDQNWQPPVWTPNKLIIGAPEFVSSGTVATFPGVNDVRWYQFGEALTKWPSLAREEGALARRDEGIYAQLRRFFPVGFEPQGFTPKHQRIERAGILNVGIPHLIFQPPQPLQTADYRWYETTPHPSSQIQRNRVRGLFLRGDETPMPRLNIFVSYGPHGFTPPMLRQVWRQGTKGAYLRGYDGIDNLFELGFTNTGSNLRIVYVDIHGREVSVAVGGRIVYTDITARSVEVDITDRGTNT